MGGITGKSLPRATSTVAAIARSTTVEKSKGNLDVLAFPDAVLIMLTLRSRKSMENANN
jgi:hypothetical protein